MRLLPQKYIATFRPVGVTSSLVSVPREFWAWSQESAEIKADLLRPPGMITVRVTAKKKPPPRGTVSLCLGVFLLAAVGTVGVHPQLIGEPPKRVVVGDWPSPGIKEDDDGWNCQTMGNGYCGLLGQERMY